MKMLAVALVTIWLAVASEGQDCQREGTIDCSSAMDSPYRTFDGSCNRDDEERAKWNKAHTCYNRIMSPDYPDFWGNEIRHSVDGSSLPNARELSNLLSSEETAPRQKLLSRVHSQMLMNFGQVLGNEITYPGSLFTYMPDAHTYNCCANYFASNFPKWQDCAEVRFSKSDPLYSRFGVSCINFSRSQACSLCKFGQRSAINMHTPPIDGSTIYGNSVNDSNNKREFKGGRLKLDSLNYPINLGKKEDGNCGHRWTKFYPEEEGLSCFRAGDTYANNNPPKASLVIILYRQHNRIADMLSSVNPGWSDERLFLETRKIVGAQMEMITYQEFLPEIIGPKGMKIFSLEPLERGYIGFDPDTNPSTTAEFTSTVMRSIGHSMVNGNLKAKFFDGTTFSYRLHDYYHYFPNFTQGKGIIDAYLRGTVTEPIKKVDTLFDISIRGMSEKVAKNGPPYGTDLITVDIMRGRDFGVPSYTVFRKHCFNEIIESFSDLEGAIDSKTLSKLSSIYKTVQDIDLYYGLLAEKKAEGALVGPTAVCLWGREFYNKKFGDRYFFEQGAQSGSFTPEQLRSIRQTRLAKMICANGDEYPEHKIQWWVMRLPDEDDNPEVYCSQIADLDVSAWAEQQTD